MNTRISVLLLVLGNSLALSAATPVGWRMDGSSSFPTAKPQTKWGPADHVVWSTPMPQWSNACPVPIGDKIFVCAEPSTLICLDSAGKILWQHHADYADLPALPAAEIEKGRAAIAADHVEERLAKLQSDINPKKAQLAQLKAAGNAKDAEAKKQIDALAKEVGQLDREASRLNDQIQALKPPTGRKLPSTHPSNGYTTATPVSDGKFVYVAFGSGVVACYSTDGACQWLHFFPENTGRGWGSASSPVLIGSMLITHYLDMVALDAGTGRELWRAQHDHNWGTPAVVNVGGLTLLATDGGEVVNAADGKTMATSMKVQYCSPLAKDDVVFCADMGKAKAFRLEADGKGGVTATALWEANTSNGRHYASPLFVDGQLWLVNEDGALDVIDAKTGKVAFHQQLNLGGKVFPSMTLAGNVVIVSSDNGKSVVLKPGTTYQEVSQCVLEPFRATPVCDGGRMFIRTCSKESKLYCIGE